MQSKRIKTALVCSGVSPEHEVSLSSGATAALNLDPEQYDLLPICIRKDGGWLIPEEWLGGQRTENDIRSYFDIFRSPVGERVDGIRFLPVEDALPFLKMRSPDVVFILLHGKGGEDGVIQGFMEFAGLRYTGPGVLASALAMDKIRCLRLLASQNFHVPPYVYRLELPPEFDVGALAHVAEKKFGFPCFVKPARVGSSVGMSVANNHQELVDAIRLARMFDSQILIEEFIKGIEVTCGVIDRINGKGAEERLILPPTEIVVEKAPFFDYESKYTAGMTQEITPARLSANMLARVMDMTGEMYQLIGCSGMSRFDMIIREDEIFVLECNTIPGMTPTSLLPKGAKALGIEYPQLLDIMIHYALRKYVQ